MEYSDCDQVKLEFGDERYFVEIQMRFDETREIYSAIRTELRVSKAFIEKIFVKGN